MLFLFFNGGSKLLAKNFDWSSGHGYIIKNIRGQQKFAYGFRGENVAEWTSKYGSITFNQIGKEFPYGGINEKGLVIEQLWLSTTEYQDNHTKYLSELEWIQYQLDSYKTVDEVIENINNLTIKPNATVHFLLADSNGVSAVIEFINGKVTIDRQQGKFQIITNETSKKSLDYFQNNPKINKDSRDVFDRYCILTNNLNIENLDVISAFSKLNLVKEDSENYKTYWSIVYDITKLEISFTSADNENIKKISLSDFNFDENSDVQFSLINSNQIDFQNYQSQNNKVLLTESMKMMNLEIDIDQANAHQLKPSQISIDTIYQSKYADLIVVFSTKKVSGVIWYSIIKGENNFKSYNGFAKGRLTVTNTINRKVFYGFPLGEFAVASFQDTNADGYMDKNLLGIPTNTGFSNNKKKIFGIPPSYTASRIIFDKPTSIEIKID